MLSFFLCDQTYHIKRMYTYKGKGKNKYRTNNNNINNNNTDLHLSSHSLIYFIWIIMPGSKTRTHLRSGKNVISAKFVCLHSTVKYRISITR